ncbi:hypothetical protein BCV72DRAFT_224679 [Rhizopus microsporus var. microsporus]|uniref:Secreted protein n=1 Tax=Rhizopus microsporus var. microsporus TaxID=86635 RepID=A0A1X0R9C8_RHIZD|nr:hypothetical protein BCV72DRAFT_224679 [Rhizopus microsporus var. microsporus]
MTNPPLSLLLLFLLLLLYQPIRSYHRRSITVNNNILIQVNCLSLSMTRCLYPNTFRDNQIIHCKHNNGDHNNSIHPTHFVTIGSLQQRAIKKRLYKVWQKSLK